MDEKVMAVVVTYNRKELLLECLNAILIQSYSVEKILLIDNASTDGTKEALQQKGYLDSSKICYVDMKINTGGSGGFYEGIRRASLQDCDWLWVMDDDTIPNVTCLEELVRANTLLSQSKKEVSFLASTIYGENGEYMNLPSINLTPSDNGYEYWYEFLKDGMVGISCATFVSLLIKKDAVVKCGLPCKEYFIWGDDTEYTTRLTTFFADAYFVGKSIAVHKRIGAKALRIDNEEDNKRIEMYHYLYRNRMITNRYYNKNYHYIVHFVREILNGSRYLGKPKGVIRMKTIIRGYWEGLTQYKKFARYIDEQLKNVN